MKSIQILLLMSLIAVSFGCATANKSESTNKSEVDIDRVVRIAGLAAEVGAVTYLQKNPDKREAFQKVVTGLSFLESTGDFNPAKFAAELQALPIKQLKGPEGSLYITVALVAWEELNANAKMGKLDNVKWVKPVLTRVKDGLARALEATKPADIR